MKLRRWIQAPRLNYPASLYLLYPIIYESPLCDSARFLCEYGMVMNETAQPPSANIPEHHSIGNLGVRTYVFRISDSTFHVCPQKDSRTEFYPVWALDLMEEARARSVWTVCFARYLGTIIVSFQQVADSTACLRHCLTSQDTGPLRDLHRHRHPSHLCQALTDDPVSEVGLSC